MNVLTAALGAATKIPGELKKLGKAEMAETVLAVSQGAYEQMSENLELKEKVTILKDDIRNLKDENKKLKDVEIFRLNARYENDCYWDEKGIPICSACLEKSSQPAIVRMHTDGREDGFVTCPHCKTHAWSKGAVPITIVSSGGENYDPYAVF